MRIEPVASDDDVRAAVAVVQVTDPRADLDEQGALHAVHAEPRRLDLVGRDGNGLVVATGWVEPMGGSTDWAGTVQVLPAARRQGAGSAILALLEAHAAGAGAAGIEVESRSDEGLAFLVHHGFREVGREAEVALDLQTASLEAGELPAGVTIVRRSDHPGLEQALYRIAQEAEPDIPADEPRGPGSFADFLAVNLDRPERRPELTFIAIAEGTPIGYAILHAGPRHVAYHGMTAVLRSWRGRGIASALKRRQIAAAAGAGYTLLVTENELRNTPIRRLNAAFGYEPYGETVFLRRPVRATPARDAG